MSNVIDIKAKDIQLGDGFVGFGKVVAEPVIEDGTVWVQIGYSGKKPQLFAMDADMDISTKREAKV